MLTTHWVRFLLGSFVVKCDQVDLLKWDWPLLFFVGNRISVVIKVSLTVSVVFNKSNTNPVIVSFFVLSGLLRLLHHVSCRYKI